MTWQQFLTEKVLKECYHEGSSLLNAGYHCRKCDKIFTCNRTFDTDADMMALFRKMVDKKEFINFRVCAWEIDGNAAVSTWLFYEPERFCWLVSEWLMKEEKKC